MASPGMQGIGNGFLEGLQLSKQMDRQENQEQRQQKRMDMAEQKHGLAIEQTRDQMAHNEKMRPLERETQELSNELTRTEKEAQEQKARREQIKRNMQMQTPAFEKALESEDYAAVGEFMSRNMTGVSQADVVNNKDGQLTLAAEGEDGEMYSMPVNDDALRRMWYKGAGMDEPEQDELTYKDGVFFNNEGEVVQDHRDRLGLDDGTGGDAPADVQTVNWMVENGVARNAEQGWRKLRQSMSMPPEEAIQDFGQTLIDNNPRQYRDNPSQAMEDARRIYHEKINPGARGGGAGGGTGGDAGAGGLDLGGGGSDTGGVVDSLLQGGGQQGGGEASADAQTGTDQGLQVPYRQPQPQTEPQGESQQPDQQQPDQSGLSVPAPNRPGDAQPDNDPSMTDPRQDNGDQGLFPGVSSSTNGDAGEGGLNLGAGPRAEASTPDYQYTERPEPVDEAPVIDPEQSAGASARESLNEAGESVSNTYEGVANGLAAILGAKTQAMSDGAEAGRQAVEDAIGKDNYDRVVEAASGFVDEAGEGMQEVSLSHWMMTPGAKSLLGDGPRAQAWEYLKQNASDFMNYQQMSPEAERFWQAASEGATPSVQDLQAANEHMKSLPEGSVEREQQRKVLREWVKHLKNGGSVASEQEVDNESEG